MRRTWPVMLLVATIGVSGAALLHVSRAWSEQQDASATKNLARVFLDSLDTQAGFCVHLGVRGDGLTTALSRGGKYLVHGLAAENAAVVAARANIDEQKLAGVVSVERLSPDKLPYADNLAALVVVDDVKQLTGQGLSLTEIQRVLRPGGVAWIGQRSNNGKTSLSRGDLEELLRSAGVTSFEIVEQDGLWAKYVAPRPESLDQWTHKRHDAGGNPVSTDREVDVPTGVRWAAGPNWPTGYRKSAVPAVVSTERRLVYIFQDEVDAADGSQLQDSLIARDAFSGLLLWKQKATKQSAALASVGDRVYAVLEDRGPLVALEADTGRKLLAYEGTVAPQQVLVLDGRLLVDTPDGLACYDAETAELKWKYEYSLLRFVAGDHRVFVHTDDRNAKGVRQSRFVCLDLTTGETNWEAPTSWSQGTPNLILYHDGLLVAAGKKGNHAISADDGSHRWDYEYSLIGHGGSYLKVMVNDGLVWIHTANSQGTRQYAWEGLDPEKGVVVKRIVQPSDFAMKHRCSFDVATGKLFLCGSMDFADYETGEYEHFTAARNSCAAAGALPANGLIYTFPHACGCYPMLRGFLGLEDRAETDVDWGPSSGRLEKGPAYGQPIAAGQSEKPNADWRTYRHDNLRTASTASPGPETLDLLWSAQVADETPDSLALEWDQKDGGRLSSPVVADGMVLVAATDQQRLSAYDAATGKPQWTFHAAARIDCPPTIHDGLCLLGARDGCLYCLRARDGELVWKFRAAPRDERIVAYGQLESKWPVVGGVLVEDDVAYCVVGRHSGADGGITVVAVDIPTGELVWSNQPTGYEGVPDLLNAADGTVQMADYDFDAKTGALDERDDDARLSGGRLGILNDAWYRRPIAMRKNLQQWQATGHGNAQMLAYHQDATCGFLACSRVAGGDGAMSGDAQLFVKAEGGGKDWALKMPHESRLRGMAVTPRRTYVAGLLPDADDEKQLRRLVRSYVLADGRLAAEAEIDGVPVHDGLAIAGHRVYVCTQQGRLICLGEK
ncbi:MAG: PQQ-binding-like beta-propeller repeat protein [Pirellulaceae bacterium]